MKCSAWKLNPSTHESVACESPATHLVVVIEQPQARNPETGAMVNLGQARQTLRPFCIEDGRAETVRLRGLSGVVAETYTLKAAKL